MFYVLRSSHQRCSTKKVFLKFLQNSLENTCIGVPTLIKFKLASKKVCPQPLPLPPVFGFSLEYPWAVPAKNKQGGLRINCFKNLLEFFIFLIYP